MISPKPGMHYHQKKAKNDPREGGRVKREPPPSHPRELLTKKASNPIGLKKEDIYKINH